MRRSVRVCSFYFFTALYILKKMQKIRLGILWWSNVTIKSTRFYFYCHVNLFYVLINIQKKQKHSHNQKTQKYFYNKPWFKIKWSFFLFSFLIKYQINFNHTLSPFFFQYKKYKPILICHLAFHFKTFSKIK